MYRLIPSAAMRVIACLTVLSGLTVNTAFAGICSNQIEIAAASCLLTAAPLTACEDQLLANPNSLPTRIGLCDVLAEQQQLAKAIEITEAGLKQHKDRAAVSIISRALSNVRERKTAERAQPQLETLIDYMAIRCNDLGKLDACEDIIQARPTDSRGHTGLGKLMLAEGSVVNAIGSFQKALELQPDMATALAGLEQAKNLRQANSRHCFEGPEQESLLVCKNALLVGAADETNLVARLARISSVTGNYSQALEYYRRLLTLRRTGTEKVHQPQLPNKVSANPTSARATTAITYDLAAHIKALRSGVSCETDPRILGAETCIKAAGYLAAQSNTRALAGGILFEVCKRGSVDAKHNAQNSCRDATKFAVNTERLASLKGYAQTQQATEQKIALAAIPIVDNPRKPSVEPESTPLITAASGITEESAHDDTDTVPPQYENSPLSSVDGIEVVTF